MSFWKWMKQRYTNPKRLIPKIYIKEEVKNFGMFMVGGFGFVIFFLYSVSGYPLLIIPCVGCFLLSHYGWWREHEKQYFN